ncbi:nicotinate (nicotinamide) nucleotide adenylyltransferase [Aeromonas diversa CDC 2478-85]|uniref:Probable nicotinate-nucleotide adenylyltransferase n=1 Tax=Aeromonas diversa CDC 2478-85 TaxID=1268237 RepID=N9VNX0_9GAMM|nr:nicotinate-nucleotide adenylyltransferase [Aeromonas diversa]ENY73233.1 nicotinate (nicotinamide) nucleotide adenylyltransferase [Aeromonas diversa CDC 2478-85]
MLAPPLGLLGGTFDPIHLGHLKPALAARDALRLGELRLLPNRVPPHRASPFCTPEQRLAMVYLAANEFGLGVDERELRRDRPSWTIETLEELRHELPDTPLCFLMGMDSLLSLPSWHRWDELLSLAHLVVSVRPGWDAAEATAPVQALLARHGTLRVDDLHQHRAGHIWLAHNEPQPLSSTEIRARLAAGNDPGELLPESVANYIRNNRLYAGQSGPVL